MKFSNYIVDPTINTLNLISDPSQEEKGKEQPQVESVEGGDNSRR